MDSMSYRNNRQASRQTPEQAATVSEPSTAVHQAPKAAKAPAKQPKRPLKYLIGVLFLALLVIGAWYLVSRSNISSAIDSGKYQAVFFTNGQVYFGKLSTINDEYMRLTNVYYLQTKSATDDKETSPQSASKQNSSDVELIKLGGEIHGPEDAMIIAKDQVLFFENLKQNGNVSQTITNYQNQKKAE